MARTSKQRRRRRSFTEEFKAGAVRLVLDEAKTIAQVARDLDLTPSALVGRLSRRGRTGARARLASPPRSAPPGGAGRDDK
jgi:transposase-like protein